MVVVFANIAFKEDYVKVLSKLAHVVICQDIPNCVITKATWNIILSMKRDVDDPNVRARVGVRVCVILSHVCNLYNQLVYIT